MRVGMNSRPRRPVKLSPWPDSLMHEPLLGDLALEPLTMVSVGSALIRPLAALFGGIFNQDAKRRTRKQNGFVAWATRIANAASFDELDYLLGPGAYQDDPIPDSRGIAAFRDTWWPTDRSQLSTRNPGFSPETDLRWNTVVFLNLDAVPDFVEKGSALIRAKIAQLQQGQGIPSGAQQFSQSVAAPPGFGPTAAAMTTQAAALGPFDVKTILLTLIGGGLLALITSGSSRDRGRR